MPMTYFESDSEERALASLEGCTAEMRPQCHAAALRGLRYATAPQDDGYGQSHCSYLPPRELVGAELAGDLVEHRVHHAGLLRLDEGVRDIDIFRHHDAARHILAML